MGKRAPLPGIPEVLSCVLLTSLLVGSFGGYEYGVAYVMYRTEQQRQPIVWGGICLGGTALA